MSAMQQAAELRRAKEQFVSNLHGTTKWEVFCAVSCLPLCLLIAAYAEAWAVARGRAAGKPLSRLLLALPKFGYEFGLVVAPQVLLLMSLAPAEPAFLLLFLLWGSLALKLWMKLGHSPGSRQHMAHMLAHISAPRKRFVSVFRGGLMLTTCLAILGVDFAAFPRRYAKAEGYGTGLMDVGVGAIMWAGGLVSAAAAAAAATPAPAPAAGAVPDPKSVRQRGSCSWLTVTRRRLGRGLRAALPLVALGGARLVATSVVGYQQHVGEYGLAWNFFWSIAGVSLATLALPVPPGWLGPLGLAVSGAHQALLSTDLRLTHLTAPLGADSTAAAAEAAAARGSAGTSGALPVHGSLGAWLHAELPAEQRSQLGFLAANKEGVGSLPGYWALHLLGAAVGHQLAAGCAAAAGQGRACLAAGGNAGGSSSRAAAAVGECARVVWSWVGRLLLADCAVWLALLAAEAWLEPVSRRSCNLAYVLWVTAQCMAWLLLCLMGDLLTSGLAGAASSSPPSPILSSRILARGSSSSAEPAAGAAALLATGPGSSAAGGPAGALRQRPAAKRRSASSPTAALAAAGAAAAAAAAGGGGSEAAGAARGVAAVLGRRISCDVPDSPAVVGAGQQPTAHGSPASSSSSDGTAAAAAVGAPGTPERFRRLPQPQQPQQTQLQAAGSAGPASGSSSSSSSGGPMRLMLSFNRNMLALFLAANLLTGAVNLSINTLAVGRWGARSIVGLYMLLLCGLAVRLDNAGITLKLW